MPRLVDTPDAARDALVRQVTGAVKWERCMHHLIAHGVETFVEVGPGKVLCGLMRQIDRSRSCVNVENEASLQKTSDPLRAREDRGVLDIPSFVILSEDAANHPASERRTCFYPPPAFCTHAFCTLCLA